MGILCISSAFFVLAATGQRAAGAEIEFDSGGQLSQLQHTIAATRRGASTVGACVGTCAVLASWGNDDTASTDGASGADADNLRTLAYPVPRIWLLGNHQALGGAGLYNDAQVRLCRSRESCKAFVR